VTLRSLRTWGINYLPPGDALSHVQHPLTALRELVLWFDFDLTASDITTFVVKLPNLSLLKASFTPGAMRVLASSPLSHTVRDLRFVMSAELLSCALTHCANLKSLEVERMPSVASDVLAHQSHRALALTYRVYHLTPIWRSLRARLRISQNCSCGSTMHKNHPLRAPRVAWKHSCVAVCTSRN